MRIPLGKQLSPILSELEGAILDHSVALPGVAYEFSKEDMTAACQIFSSVLIDRMFALMKKESMSMEDGEKMAEHAGDQINKLVKEMTGIDTKKIYK